MKDNKFLIGVGIAMLGLFGGFVYMGVNAGKTAEVEAETGVKAVVEESAHDWGEIGIDDGKVEAGFLIRNEGSGVLRLSNVSTSCMCTSASLEVLGKVSPEFGMHGKSSYVAEVPSGEAAKLKVVFDPAFHGPSGVGPINRQIVVETNDPSQPELNFMVTAVVRK